MFTMLVTCIECVYMSIHVRFTAYVFSVSFCIISACWAVGLEANLATVTRDLEHRVSKQARESQGEPGRARESPKIEKNTEHAVNQGQIQRRQSEPCTLTRLEIVKQVELMFTSHSSRFATSTPREMVGFSKLNIIGVNSTGLFGLSCANADPGPTWESFCPICEQVKECGKIAE